MKAGPTWTVDPNNPYRLGASVNHYNRDDYIRELLGQIEWLTKKVASLLPEEPASDTPEQPPKEKPSPPTKAKAKAGGD